MPRSFRRGSRAESAVTLVDKDETPARPVSIRSRSSSRIQVWRDDHRGQRVEAERRRRGRHRRVRRRRARSSEQAHRANRRAGSVSRTNRSDSSRRRKARSSVASEAVGRIDDVDLFEVTALADRVRPPRARHPRAKFNVTRRSVASVIPSVHPARAFSSRSSTVARALQEAWNRVAVPWRGEAVALAVELL